MPKTRGTAHERGYTARWRKARANYLRRHPLCSMCKAREVTSAATVVDHIVPHKGDATLFWDEGNWQGLCATDHNATKRVQEATGVLRGCDVDGMPLDPNHRWATS